MKDKVKAISFNQNDSIRWAKLLRDKTVINGISYTIKHLILFHDNGNVEMGVVSGEVRVGRYCFRDCRLNFRKNGTIEIVELLEEQQVEGINYEKGITFFFNEAYFLYKIRYTH